MFNTEREVSPVAYANLVRLKRPAEQLFERMKRL
jgi:hypothetical protein